MAKQVRRTQNEDKKKPPLEQRWNVATHNRKSQVIPAYNEDDYTVDTIGGTRDRVLASGVVEALPFAIGAGIAAVWAASQKSDINWAAGQTAVSFFVAGGARNNSLVRDSALGILAGSVTVLGLRALNKLKLASGQQ